MRILFINFMLIFVCAYSQTSNLSQCNEPKNCSAYINKYFPNKKKMLSGIKVCLLENYSESEFRLIPPENLSETFSLRYQYFVNELINVDKNVAEVEIVMNLFWKDDCLRWNNKEIIYFPYLIMNTKDIWVPTVFVSSKIAPMFSQDDAQVIVHSSGDCEESFLYRVKIICDDFPMHFPNDYQICQINFQFKLITNFTLSLFNESQKICISNNLELGEWFIECGEFLNTEEVISTNERWPFLSSVNNLYLGNITGKFKVKRFPHYTYSSIMLPSLIVCVCSQLISLIPPYSQNYATILSSLFLSLNVVLNNFHDESLAFNKFSLLSLILNWIYCLCASNVIIIIYGSTIATKKQACLPWFQRYYLQICLFNEKPISLLSILSLSITLPILGALLFKGIYGFISGIICMIAFWILIALYLTLARISSVKFKSENDVNEKEQSSTDLKNSKSKKDDDDKYQISKLTQAVDQLTLAIQQFIQRYHLSSGGSLLNSSSIAEIEQNDRHFSITNTSFTHNEENNNQLTQIDTADINKNNESPTISEEKEEFEIIQNNEITTDPVYISTWNVKLALCICRLWTCFQILGNIFLNITLWVIYYRVWGS